MLKFSPKHSLYMKLQSPLFGLKTAILTHISGTIGVLNNNII